MSASKLEKNIANLERRMREEFRMELEQAGVDGVRWEGFGTFVGCGAKKGTFKEGKLFPNTCD